MCGAEWGLAWGPAAIVKAAVDMGGGWVAQWSGAHGCFYYSNVALGLTLYAAAPGVWCRHGAASGSFFDRLWRSGVSKPSAREERYVLCVRRRVAALSDGRL